MKKEDQLKLKDKMRIVIKILNNLKDIDDYNVSVDDFRTKIWDIRDNVLILMDTICDDYEL